MPAKRKRRRRKATLYGVFSVAVIIVLAAIGIGVFFRVNKVEVEGAGYYSEEQILETADIKTGNIIFFTGTNDARQRLYETMPYIYSVDIVRKLPDTITVRVNESTGICSVLAQGSRWLLDEHCKVLGKVEGTGGGALLQVTGLNIEQVQIGKVLTVSDDQKTHLESLINILKAVRAVDVAGHMSDLDVSNISNAKFVYDDKFLVDFGNGVDAERKMNLLVDAVAHLEYEPGGRIDLTREGRAHYIPE